MSHFCCTGEEDGDREESVHLEFMQVLCKFIFPSEQVLESQKLVLLKAKKSFLRVIAVCLENLTQIENPSFL